MKKVILMFILLFILLNISNQKDITFNAENTNDNEMYQDLESNPIEFNDDVSTYNLFNTETFDMYDTGENVFTDIVCIENKNYFMANPLHASNNNDEYPLGTCTTIAMQILLGYHNYYSDRRIIPETNGLGDRFLDTDYNDLEHDPLLDSTEESGYGRSSIGTSDLLYTTLLEMNNFSGLIGQLSTNVVNATNNYIDNFCAEIKNTIYISTQSYSSDVVINELNNNRPVILGFNLSSGSLHHVVAYGTAYCNGDFGYVVHCGWQSGDCYEWIPHSWCSDIITMRVNHVHRYIDTNINILDNYRKIQCTLCGAENVDYLYDVDDYTNTLNKVNYQINGIFYLPYELYGTKIEKIASNAFENQRYLEKIVLSTGISRIDDYAFKNCSRLEQISFIVDSSIVISCGNEIFYGCTKLNKITVPNDKFITYKVSENLYKYSSYISSFNTPSQINVSDDITSTISKNLSRGEHLPYKISISSNSAYIFKIHTNQECVFNIYDNNYNYISKLELNNSNGCYFYKYHLDIGEYFINFYYLNNSESANINIEIYKTTCLTYQITDTNNEILPYFHLINSNTYVSHLYYMSEYNGFYKVKLEVMLDDGTFYECNENAISIYDNIDKSYLINKYSFLDNNSFASNRSYINEIVFYINPKIYYIDIHLPYDNYNYINISIEPVEYECVNLFELPSNNDIILFNYLPMFHYDNIVKFEFKQSLKLSICANGFYTGKFVIVQEKVDHCNCLELTIILNDTINSMYNRTLSLENGIYYIGFINASMPNNSICYIERVLTDYGDGFLLPDSIDAPLYGTEVTLNNGDYNSNEITQGFTRLINLYNKESRLNYYWYSSNESVARVTDFGTIMALSVTVDTPVLIMAVNKNDPSKTYVKEFIIKTDRLSSVENPLLYYIDLYVSIDDIDNALKINLNNYNVPINWLQYYLWTCEDDNILINEYGIITINQYNIDESYLIIGDYILNSRVKIYINLVITDNE